MRVALLGNLCNTAYTFAKALRKKNIEAEVFVTEKERTQIAGYPEWEDPEIDSRKTSWIHFYNQHHPASLLATFAKLRKYELIHAFGIPNVYCQFAGRPWIAHALGADLKEVVYENSVLGWLMRRAFRQADRFFYSDIDHLPHVDKQGLSQARYFTAAVEGNKYSPHRTISKHSRDDRHIAFLHASLLDWTQLQPTAKRNDLFFRAFARFARSRDDLVLRVIAAGPDVEPTKRLIAELGLLKKVEFLPPLDKQELLRHYLSCDVIVDQFGMPKFGVNALEGMACGRVVFLNLDADMARKCYPSLPPVVAARTEEDIYLKLQEIGSKEYLHELGSACREWVMKYHSSDRVADRLIEIYTEILGRSIRQN